MTTKKYIDASEFDMDKIKRALMVLHGCDDRRCSGCPLDIYTESDCNLLIHYLTELPPPLPEVKTPLKNQAVKISNNGRELALGIDVIREDPILSDSLICWAKGGER